MLDVIARSAALVAGTLAVLTALGVAQPARSQTAADPTKEPVVIGVSGPLTGAYAQYGAQWQRGFDLALEQVNASGGVQGRPLRVQFEDSQSDPKQTVAIARKFVADSRIVAELGDFTSAASMAASPIYQNAGLVQFGFTNSHPDFTKTGDFIWSNALNQAEEMPVLADYAVSALGGKRIALLFINNDWGRTSKDLFTKAAKERGAEVVGAEGYLADEKDFRSALVRVRDTKPDGIALISYYADGAQITRQLREAGLSQPVVAAGSVYSPKFLELGGAAVEGVHTTTPFFPGDPRPEVQTFVSAYTAKHGIDPDAYSSRAYDALLLLATVIRQSGPDRKAIRDGLATVKDAPSVVYGTVRFDPQTRRVDKPFSTRLVVKNGAFALWQPGSTDAAKAAN
ncbi:ABC transporter substrate-binding protein [Azospirillum griseum]|uniref:ABC transporter substrate-binding protein n=1 Tax=Azospirillum griseum TaxID=2496639 RepID=A0A431VFP9_9PROT|nr:ABC transporter substrate-binding protein [Azospirillum griseum]RTR18668.1 ABC transporter substrate-binding protein [Azospirillum griseum]